MSALAGNYTLPVQSAPQTSLPLDLPLGAIVTITGTVVGRSEFQNGRPTYLVEFDQKGRAVQEWFHGDDLDEETGEDGAGI